MRRESEVFDIPYPQHPSIFFPWPQYYTAKLLFRMTIETSHFIRKNWSLINNNCSYLWSYLTVRSSYLQSDICSITVCIMKYNFIWVKYSHVRLQNYVHSRNCCKRSQPLNFGGKPTFCIYCTAVKPIAATIDII